MGYRHLWLASALLILVVSAWAAQPLDQAKALFKEKKYSQARQAFLQVAQTDSNTTNALAARRQAAQCLFLQGDCEGFEREAQELLQEIPTTKAYMRGLLELTRAKVLLERKQHQAAIVAAEALVSKYPQGGIPFQARMFQADVYLALNRTNNAMEMVEQARKMPKLNAEQEARVKIKAASIHLKVGDYEIVRHNVDAILKQNPPEDLPGLQWAKVMQIVSYRREGQPLETAQRLEKMLAEETGLKNPVMVKRICGEAYILAADQLAAEGKKEQAAECRATGRPMLQESLRSLSELIAGDAKQAGLIANRNAIMDCYYYLRDYQNLAQAAQKQVAEFKKPGRLWIAGMFWLGVAQISQNPPDAKGAGVAFDEVLAADVLTAEPGYDLLTKAAFWRGVIAQTQGDQAKLKHIVEILKSMPDSLDKKAALERLGTVNYQ